MGAVNSTRRFLIFIIIGFIFWQSVTPAKAFAWLDCPYGEINDPYPGLCELYVDTNNNQICDHSESTPQDSQTKALQTRTQQRSFEISLWYLFLTASFYFLHWFAANKTKLKRKKGFLSPVGFKYFWNLILLATFIPVGISGLLLGLGVKNQSLLYWHNNLGSTFTIIALFHLINHFNYYLKPLKQKS